VKAARLLTAALALSARCSQLRSVCLRARVTTLLRLAQAAPSGARVTDRADRPSFLRTTKTVAERRPRVGQRGVQMHGCVLLQAHRVFTWGALACCRFLQARERAALLS